MQLLILLSLVAPSLALLGIGSQQSVAVTGKLNCDGKPAVGVKVKLYEKESLIDVKMDEGKTNKDGEFHLSGHKTEISKIDPKPCYRKFGITIPDNYITKGKTPKKTFDIGVINLANKFTGETTDCIN
ncbi:Transthyretin-like family protein [Ancylostoma caninum]|uniref:Transthyretin-like family protein n=1 Tax=Ancylostoma caninum TaxID=29170 RepID=A0A368GAH2_ANCCA|nr:Transthyretin-like family protein [Ancylostoma caninum]